MTIDVPLHDICLGERQRPVDPRKVAEIAKSIEREGLYQAIGVLPCTCAKQAAAHYRLLFGAHRLAAFEMLEWEAIAATVWAEGLPEERYLLIELQENSARNDLSSVQRKAYAAEIGRISEKLGWSTNSENFRAGWLSKFAEQSNVITRTMINWWNTFCAVQGMTLRSEDALEKHRQQFYDWLADQQREAEEEKVRKEAEAQEQQRLKALEEGRDTLEELIHDYGQQMVWDEVVTPIFADWLAIQEEDC